VHEALSRQSRERGLWRFRAALPSVDAITLGEGDTPLVRLDAVAAELGLANLYAKNEAANPTWSHKDRLAALTVAAAKASGARVIAAASTGNHGAAIAAYAARARLRCVIATLPSVPPAMRELMAAYGAHVVATSTSEERYELIGAGVDEYGWYPASNLTFPPVGSDAYGISGYHTIAYELLEQLGRPPDWVVVPVAYGDCLAGIVAGFRALHAAELISRVPRMLAVELFGALERALRQNDFAPAERRPTRAFSIAANAATYQAVAALRRARGSAVSVSESEIAAASARLSASEGLYVEAAAAATVAAVRAFAAEGRVHVDDNIVCLLTSSGLKNEVDQPKKIPVIPARLEALRDALAAWGELDAEAYREVFAAPTTSATR
jgi:threonine synthase